MSRGRVKNYTSPVVLSPTSSLAPIPPSTKRSAMPIRLAHFKPCFRIHIQLLLGVEARTRQVYRHPGFQPQELGSAVDARVMPDGNDLFYIPVD